MPFSTGARHQLSYIAESTFGVTPGTPAMAEVRHTSCSLDLTKEGLQSQELRPDGQIVDFRHGNKQVGGDIGTELSYGAFDDFLEACLGGTWATGASAASQTITVAATGKTFTRAAGDYIADGFLVGDVVTFSGFTNAENNVTGVVTALTTTVMNLGWATGLIDEAGDANEGVVAKDSLRAGTLARSFTFERGFTDVAQYLVYTGCAINKWALSVAPNQIVTSTFSLVGKSMDSPSASPLDASVTAAPTNSPYDSFSGVIKEGGTVIAVITGIELSLDNGLTPAFVVGSDSTPQLIPNRSNLTGTINAYFEDAVLLNKFINETETTLYLTLGTGASELGIVIPRFKYTGGSAPVQGSGEITMNMPIQALYSATYGSNIIVTR